MKAVRLLRLPGVPILQQLRIEQALLRADDRNWLVVNDGSSVPAIVMGISGSAKLALLLWLIYRDKGSRLRWLRKAEELIHIEDAKKAKMEIIKRFSGGGTVVVDQDTVFATWIMNGASVPHVECYPRPIMKWTEGLLQPIFNPYGNFRLACHDYVFDDMKFGGNAQAITKQRWLHHTSFLWDFQKERMALLQHPARIPDYRKGREHLKFLIRLKDVMSLRSAFLSQLEAMVTKQGFELQESSLDEVDPILDKDHLRSTKVLEL